MQGPAPWHKQESPCSESASALSHVGAYVCQYEEGNLPLIGRALPFTAGEFLGVFRAEVWLPSSG